MRGLGRATCAASVCELQDTPAVRGMINKVSYRVKVINKVALTTEVEEYEMELN